MSTRIVPSYETHEFDAKKNPYCICVFVINEGEKLLNQLKTMSGICSGLVDIVVADGGSRDGSTDHGKLKELGVNTLLVKTGEGKLGSQMRMAFDWALNRGYKGVVVVDGNGKDGMDAIPRFVKELENGVDHVQGSRFIKGGHHENTPKSRLWGLKLLHVPLMRIASGFKYTDTTNGFRAYSARLLSSDKLNIFRDCFAGYELHYYLAIEAARQKFICSEIPVSRVYPANGKVPTKISGMKGNAMVLLKLFMSCLHLYSPKRTLLKYIKTYLIFVLSIAFGYLAFQSYYHNAYSVVDDKEFEQWQQSSEGIVVRDKIDPETRLGKWYSLHPMGGKYIGGQGFAGSFLCHLFEDSPLEKKLDVLHAIEVLLTVASLVYLCFWIGTEFSLLASVLFAVCAINCQFMVISTRNIYWSQWTMYLPLAVFLYFLRKDEGEHLKRCIIPSYLIAVAATMFVRFVSLFEYASSIMVLTELPLLYYAVKNQWSSKKFLLNSLWTGMVAVAVFIFSYLILYVQLLVYRANMNFSSAWDLVTANVRYRTGVGGENQPEILFLSFLPDLSSIIEKYLDFLAFVGDSFEYKVSTVIYWAFIFFFIGALATILMKQFGIIRKYIAFGAFVFLSTLLQFIWIITAKGHSQIHVHINWILWSISMVLMAALIGYSISILLALAYNSIRSIKKNMYAMILTAATVCGLYALGYLYYKSNYSGYELLLKRFETLGQPVVDSDIRYLIFPEQKKIFLLLPNGQAESHSFFYHIYPVFEENLTAAGKATKFNNSDFSIKSKFDKSFILKPFFSKSKNEIIQCQLPSYLYSRIYIGQYDSSQRYWTLELKSDIPETRSYTICNLTDINWTSGVRNTDKKCLLFRSNQFIMKDDYVTLPDKTVARVERVKAQGIYLYVFLENESPSFDPNQPCIFSRNKPVSETQTKSVKPEIRSYTICNLTDKNWTSGIRNTDKKCLLFKSNQSVTNDDYVIFPDKTVARVKQVEVQGEYLHVFLDKDAPSFDPNQPCIFSKNEPESDQGDNP